MMDPTEHPEDQLILNYVKAPGADGFNELRLHLADCRYCRRRTELTALLREQGHWLESEAVEPDARIAELIAGNLSTEQVAELQQDLKQDPDSLRAALHYASHARAMDELKQARQNRVSVWTLIPTLLQQCFSFKAPIWKTVPAVAVLLVLATLIVDQIVPQDNNGVGRVIVFSDNQVIQFVGHESQPGIGFFNQPTANTEPFTGMSVEVIGHNRLRLIWPEVETVQAYKLKLQVFRDGETQVLARRTLATTSVDLEIAEPLTQHRYEWIVSGDTSDNRSFQASGGFVIARD